MINLDFKLLHSLHKRVLNFDYLEELILLSFQLSNEIDAECFVAIAVCRFLCNSKQKIRVRIDVFSLN